MQIKKVQDEISKEISERNKTRQELSFKTEELQRV